MPSFKIAGKSKDDLVAIAQIAGLLTAAKAKRMTKADLINFLEQENARTEAAAAPLQEPVAAEAPAESAAEPAAEPVPQAEEPAAKRPARRTRKKTQPQPEADSAVTAEAAANEPAAADEKPRRRAAGRTRRPGQGDESPPDGAESEKKKTRRSRKRTAAAAPPEQIAMAVEPPAPASSGDEPAAVAKQDETEIQPAQTGRPASRKRKAFKIEEQAGLEAGQAEEMAEAAGQAAGAAGQRDRTGAPAEPEKTAAAAQKTEQTNAAVAEESSPEATEAAAEKEDRPKAEKTASSPAGNRRTNDFSGTMTRIPRSRISTRQIRPTEADRETVPSDEAPPEQQTDEKPEGESMPETPAAASNEEQQEEKPAADTPAAEPAREKRPMEQGDLQGGVLEIMPDGYGFLRRDNYLQGNKDIYVPPQYIRRFNLRPGDYVNGPVRLQRENDRYQALLYIKDVNGLPPEKMIRRPHFDRLTPIYPNERFVLETVRNELSTRIIDLVAPIGKGQRGMIVSPPKAGKTILLQKIANAVSINNPETKLIVLLIDERPEEVTDMQRSIKGEVVYSTFDKTPENHTKVVELVLERAMRLVELKQDVMILLDSMTRLARAYNLTINPTGRTLSGGLDPGALYGPKRFFGAARNIENGGSLTIIATSLIETGSRMDEVIFEEFKGTGNMEVYLDRKLSEKRIFPAIDINKSGTRREELLMNNRELDAVWTIRKAFSQLDTAAVTEAIINLLLKTKNNEHFISSVNVSFNDKNVFEAMRGTRPGSQPAGGSGSNVGYSSGGSYNNGGTSSSYRRFNNNQNDDD